jgi:ribosomal protein S27AE
MAINIDGTAVLKRRIEDLIHDIKHLPEAAHAIRELRILNNRLTIARAIVSYKIGENNSYILCYRCGKMSFNPDDVKNVYCGNCHIFHEKPWIEDTIK